MSYCAFNCPFSGSQSVLWNNYVNAEAHLHSSPVSTADIHQLHRCCSNALVRLHVEQIRQRARGLTAAAHKKVYFCAF